MKLAVFLPNWLGDLTMATPTLRALRRHLGPQANLVGILRPYLAGILVGTDWLDEQWYFDPWSSSVGLRGAALVRRMRRRQFDAALLLTNSFRTALLAYLGQARERIGYVRDGRGLLLSGKLYPRRDGRRLAAVPTVESYLESAHALGCPKESPRLELATTSADEASADAVFRALGLRDDGRLIALNCGGAYGESKFWPVEYFAELAGRIAERLDHDVLVLCGSEECETAREVVRLSDSARVFSMADQPLDLGTAKACVRRTRAIVSTDSGLRHVAAAFGKPTITLFGSMLPAWSENPTQHAVNMLLDLDCIGCRRRTCPKKHHRCMRGLTVDMVYAEVVKLLQQGEAASAA